MSREAVTAANPVSEPRGEGLRRPYSPRPRYQYNAKAVAAGGVIYVPKPRPIPTQAAAAIPSVGGVSKIEGGRLRDAVLRVEGSSSFVQGIDVDGRHKIETRARVRGLAIAGRFKADKIHAQAASSSAAGEYPSFSFDGTEVEGLSIDGRKIHLDIDLELFEQLDTWEKLDRAFSGRDSSAKLNHRFYSEAGHGSESGMPLIRGQAHASVVTGIQVEGRPRQDGHVLSLPGFGTLYFGEVWISEHWRRLILFRAELSPGLCRQFGERPIGLREKSLKKGSPAPEHAAFMIVNEDETETEGGGGDIEVGAVEPHGEGLP